MFPATAEVLATLPDRHFLCAGHTDNVPVRSGHFKNNWDLSTARAVEVTQFLIAKGMKPQVLAAAGYGEFDPLSGNDTAEHRAQNRRIEIVLMTSAPAAGQPAPSAATPDASAARNTGNVDVPGVPPAAPANPAALRAKKS